MSAPPIPPTVAGAFESLGPALRDALLDVRSLVFEVARRSGTAPLNETLKWGQPAYRPSAPRTGTTLRLWHQDGRAALFVPCSTNLVDGYRRDLPGAFDYAGDRAVLFGPDVDDAALATCIARALTYHREKVTP